MKIDVLQSAVNLLDYRAARPVLEAAKALGARVMARSALASGLLGGAYADALAFTDPLRRRYGETPRNRAIFAERMEKVREIRAWFEGSGLPGGFAAFCYSAALSLPGVDALLVGGSRESQLLENLSPGPAALPAERAEEVARLAAEAWAAPYL